MQFVKRVDLFQGYWRSLGQLPERFAIFCLGIKRVGIQKLHYVVPENLEEHLSRDLDRIVEICWSSLDQSSALS